MEWVILLVLVIVLLSFLREVKHYERGVMLTFGKFTGVRKPGWSIVVPVFQQMIKVDLRVKAVDVPDQKVITRDNVSASINAVIYYKVADAAKAVLEVEDFFFAVSQLAQTTMRNIVGKEATAKELMEYNLDHEGVATNMIAHDGMNPLKDNIQLAQNYQGQQLAYNHRQDLESRMAKYSGPHALCWARPDYVDGGTYYWA